MKASKLLLCLLISTSASALFANNEDSLKIVRLEQSLQKEIRAREALSTELAKQKQIILEQAESLESIRTAVKQNSQNIETTAGNLGVKIDETNTSLNTKAESSDVKKKAIWGGILLFILATLGCIIYYLLHKRISKGSADVNALKQKAEKLNEDILNNFSLEMAEMQKISSSLNAISKSDSTSGSTASGESDHSLIKTLADRITFMEMTLYKMDPKIRGYKQLSKSISQMKDNLLANGYEIVEMLGKPYNDGMKVTANFTEDEELEVGQQIITGIIKPQINYNGKMIQSAQITVSQNL